MRLFVVDEKEVGGPENLKFEIWVNQGKGGGPTGIEFSSLNEAIKYTDEHKGEASFAIKYPDGNFYKWDRLQVGDCLLPYSRVNRGMTFKKALITPVEKRP